MEECNIIPNGKQIFVKTVFPRDTGIPFKHDYIFIKEVDKPNGIWYHGGKMPYTTFRTLGRGDEGDKILKCYTFDLFTLSINIHKQYSDSMRFLPFLA